MRRDCKYCATVSRGDDFLAFEEKEFSVLMVSVFEENIEVYAVISTESFVSQYSIFDSIDSGCRELYCEPKELPTHHFYLFAVGLIFIL